MGWGEARVPARARAIAHLRTRAREREPAHARARTHTHLHTGTTTHRTALLAPFFCVVEPLLTSAPSLFPDREPHECVLLAVVEPTVNRRLARRLNTQQVQHLANR